MEAVKWLRSPLWGCLPLDNPDISEPFEAPEVRPASPLSATNVDVDPFDELEEFWKSRFDNGDEDKEGPLEVPDVVRG